MRRFAFAVLFGLLAGPVSAQTPEVVKEVDNLLSQLRTSEDAEVMRRLLGRAVFPAAGQTRFEFDALPLPGYGLAFALKLGPVAPDPGMPAPVAETAETCKKCHDGTARMPLAKPAPGLAAPDAKDEWQRALNEVRGGTPSKPDEKPTPLAVCYPGRLTEAVARTLTKHGPNVRLDKGEEFLTVVVASPLGWSPKQLLRADARYRLQYVPQTRMVTRTMNGQTTISPVTTYVPVYESTDDPTAATGGEVASPTYVPPAPELTPPPLEVSANPNTIPPTNVPLSPPPSSGPNIGPSSPMPSLPEPTRLDPPATPAAVVFTPEESSQLRLGELHLRQNNPKAAAEAFAKAVARFPNGRVEVGPPLPTGVKEAVSDAFKKLAQAHLAAGDFEAAKKAIDAAGKVAVVSASAPSPPAGGKLIVSVRKSDLGMIADPVELRKRMTVELRKGPPAPTAAPAGVSPPAGLNVIPS